MSAKSDARAERYARVLIEAARGEERANRDLAQLQQASEFSPEVIETIVAMHAASDLKLLDEVSIQYKTILDAEDATVSVDVTTAIPMDNDLREEVRVKAEAEFKSPVYLVEHVNPGIIGGIIIEGRGRRFDVSVRARLANIRKTLSSTYIGSDA